uniref:AMMECR1 domain-containing protein n=1 Tax=Meloidogyne incognita TaxID=6306 RepID=A0A914NZJ4_MELIC
MTRQNDSLLNKTNSTAANNSASQQVTNGVIVPNNGGKIATIDMPVHCFDVIIAHLSKSKLPKCPNNVPNENFPLFVTWKKGHQRHLRGCIGTFSQNLPLHEGLSEYAHTSAFRDSRFDPITLHEMPHLHCAVSLLVYFLVIFWSFLAVTSRLHGLHSQPLSDDVVVSLLPCSPPFFIQSTTFSFFFFSIFFNQKDQQ